MASRNVYPGEDLGATGTFRHPDGRVRSDFECGSPSEAVALLLARYPEPWLVVSLSHPQTIYTDLRGRKQEGNVGGMRKPPTPPEVRMLANHDAQHRYSRR